MPASHILFYHFIKPFLNEDPQHSELLGEPLCSDSEGCFHSKCSSEMRVRLMLHRAGMSLFWNSCLVFDSKICFILIYLNITWA